MFGSSNTRGRLAGVAAVCALGALAVAPSAFAAAPASMPNLSAQIAKIGAQAKLAAVARQTAQYNAGAQTGALPMLPGMNNGQVIAPPTRPAGPRMPYRTVASAKPDQC